MTRRLRIPAILAVTVLGTGAGLAAVLSASACDDDSPPPPDAAGCFEGVCVQDPSPDAGTCPDPGSCASFGACLPGCVIV